MFAPTPNTSFTKKHRLNLGLRTQVLRVGYQQRRTEMKVHTQSKQRTCRQVVLVTEIITSV